MSDKQGEAGLPGWLDPELATLTRDRFSDPAWIFERKLDGERCLAFVGGGQVRLMTRNEHDISSTFPEVAEALAAQHLGDDFVVDGEIVAFDKGETKFSLLQHRFGVINPAADLLAQVPAYYYLFDVLWAGGRDVRPLPLLERKPILRRLLSFDDPLRYTEHRDTEGEAYYREACAQGWEGLIAKRADSRYRSGRTKDWLKFKCESGQEFVIGGFTDPQRSRIGFGALLLGYYDPGGRLRLRGQGRHRLHQPDAAQPARPAGRHRAATLPVRGRPAAAFGVGSALGRAPAGRRGRVQRVDPGGELRHPRFQGLRDDKGPREVVREISRSAGPRS